MGFKNVNLIMCIRYFKELLVLFRLIDSDREAIQDVPSIYFVMPTDENIKKICKVLFSYLFLIYCLSH